MISVIWMSYGSSSNILNRNFHSSFPRWFSHTATLTISEVLAVCYCMTDQWNLPISLSLVVAFTHSMYGTLTTNPRLVLRISQILMQLFLLLPLFPTLASASARSKKHSYRCCCCRYCCCCSVFWAPLTHSELLSFCHSCMEIRRCMACNIIST